MKIGPHLILMTLLSFTLTACDKDDDTGAQGPAGPKGNTGDDGNANVHSSIYNLSSADWQPYGGAAFQATIIDSNITKAIVDSGFVSISYYLSNDTWTPLPYYQTIQPNTNLYRTWTFYYSENQIIIRVVENATAGVNPGTTKFKVITIPASERIRTADISYEHN